MIYFSAERRKSCSSLGNLESKNGVSQESLKVMNGTMPESLKSSVTSSRSSLVQHSADTSSPVLEDGLDILEEEDDPETEVDVMERTSRFKISTEGPITASQKSSFESKQSCDGRASADSSKNETRVNFCESVHVASIGCSFDDPDYMKSSELKGYSKFNFEQGQVKCHRFNRASDLPNLESRRFSVRTFSENDPIFMKRARSKSVADPPTINRNKTYSIAKSKINFKSGDKISNTVKKSETDKIGTGTKPHPIIETFRSPEFNSQESISPILEKSPVSVETSKSTANSKETKRFNISLDILPNRKNGKFKQEVAIQKSLATSEDNLIDSKSSNPPSETSSPRVSKRRLINSSPSKNFLFSLLRKSSNVSKDEVPKESSL